MMGNGRLRKTAHGTMKIPPMRTNGRKMNKLEARYRDHLERLRAEGTIIDYQYEAITFRLAERTTYTPDFVVVTPECIEIHEVKGFWRDDAKVKFKVAADMCPWFRFVAVRWDKGWVYEEYKK